MKVAVPRHLLLVSPGKLPVSLPATRSCGPGFDACLLYIAPAKTICAMGSTYSGKAAARRIQDISGGVATLSDRADRCRPGLAAGAACWTRYLAEDRRAGQQQGGVRRAACLPVPGVAAARSRAVKRPGRRAERVTHSRAWSPIEFRRRPTGREGAVAVKLDDILRSQLDQVKADLELEPGRLRPRCRGCCGVSPARWRRATGLAVDKRPGGPCAGRARTVIKGLLAA